MSHVRSETRAELSRILCAEARPSEDSPKVPDESSLAHLEDLIGQGISGSPDEQRAVYEQLPLIVLRFFGYAPGTGWLETGSSCPHSHREALLRIVRPDGPVVKFCNAHSPTLGSEPKEDEWRYEFPLSNLPSVLLDDFLDVADGEAAPTHVLSALAPVLSPCLRRERDGIPAALHLSPMDYFLLCMVCSPAQKWSSGGSNFHGNRRIRPRRSSSLPSMRAMYNVVLAEHVAVAWRLSRSASGGGKSILIPACLDILFAPLTGSSGYQHSSDTSAPTVDAMCSALLAVRPSLPSELILSSGPFHGNTVYPAKETATAALYMTTQDALRASLLAFPAIANGSSQSLAALIRLLALSIAPGKESVVAAMKSALYPKPRSPTAQPGKAPALAAITSKLSSLNAQLQLPSTGLRLSPERSAEGESAWRDVTCLGTKIEADREILHIAVIKAASCRLAASSEGLRALVLLADAIHGSGMAPFEGVISGNVEEVRGCLRALGEQATEVELKSGRKNRSFLAALGSGLGVKVESASMFSGVADFVGVGSSNGGTFGMTSVGGSGSGKRRLRERRQQEIRGAGRDDVPFLGSVWERPIQRNENELALVLAYKLALWLEPSLGFSPNIRFLGRSWFLIGAAVLLTVSALIVLLLG